MYKSFKGWLQIAVLILFTFGLAACQPSTPMVFGTPTTAPTPIPPTATPIILEGATTTTSGLQYLELTAGNGISPQAGDVITMQYIASLPDGTELGNTYTEAYPVSTVWGRNLLIPGWEEGIGLMTIGGKAKLLIPPDLAFGAQGSGSVPPNSQLIIEVELLSSKPAPSPTSVAADKITKTSSGLQYYDLLSGSGEEAIKNSSVSTHYTLWVKTETGYDYINSSEGNLPVDFVVGRGDMVFPGWEEGVTGMKVGGKRLLIIPPELGLGTQASGNIPANSILVMEIQLVSTHEPRLATKVNEADYSTTPSGLKFYDLTVGTGSSPTVGQTVVVHYTGWLQDGTQFDSSVDRGEPFSFVLGTGKVIAGWDEGVLTMKIGGKRQLLIPASLAYGDQGSGSVIPPSATLIFEVELLEIKP